MCETLKLVKKIFKEWMKEDITLDDVDKNDQKMGIEDNWARGVRTTGRHDRDNKKVELFIKIKTVLSLHRLKEKVREKRREERVLECRKNSALEHVKRIVVLVETCVPCASCE